MGMFDTVRCDYPIAPEFYKVECQTKDIDKIYGGFMDYYYIDPSGRVWVTDYGGVSKYEVNPGGGLLGMFKRVPTGKHGKLKPVDITTYISIYPVNYDGSYKDIPEARLHIVDGIVISTKILKELP